MQARALYVHLPAIPTGRTDGRILLSVLFDSNNNGYSPIPPADIPLESSSSAFAANGSRPVFRASWK